MVLRGMLSMSTSDWESESGDCGGKSWKEAKERAAQWPGWRVILPNTTNIYCFSGILSQVKTHLNNANTRRVTRNGL